MAEQGPLVSDNADTQSPEALLGRWQVDMVVASWPIEWQGSPGVISFGTDGVAEFSGGCTFATRTYTASPEIVQFGPVLASRTIACAPDSAGSVLNDVVSADPRWRAGPDGHLVLRAGLGPGGVVLGEVVLRSID